MQLNNCDLKYLPSCHEKLLDGVRSQIPCPEDADDPEDANDPEDADDPEDAVDHEDADYPEDADYTEDGSNTGYSRKKYRCSLCSSSFSVPEKIESANERSHRGEALHLSSVFKAIFSSQCAHRGETLFLCSLPQELLLCKSPAITHQDSH